MIPQNLLDLILSLIFFLCCSAAPTHNLLWEPPHSPIIQQPLALSGGMISIGAGTYPRANKLDDPSMPAGSIIGVYTAFDDGDSVITIVTSQDQGATWQHRGEVSRALFATTFMDHGNILQLPSGRVLCVFANHDKDLSGTYTFYRLTICYSDDFGATWTYMDEAQSHGATMALNGMWEPFLRNCLDNTNVQLYWSQEYSTTDQDIVMIPSSDQGKTWGSIATVAGAGIESRDGMTGVASISGSKLMAVFESQQDGQFTVKRVISPDDGQTWAQRAQVYAPSGGQYSNAAAPQIAKVGGKLCVSFMTDEDNAPTAPQPSSFNDNTTVKLVVSENAGKSWGGRGFLVGKPKSLWASVFALDSSNVLAMFEQSGNMAQRLTVS